MTVRLESDPAGESEHGADGVPSTGPVVREELAAAFAALDGAGVRWLLLRGALDGSGGDVDLLVHPADRGLVPAGLAGAGYVLRRAPEQQPHRFFVRRSVVAARWFVLDVLHVVETAGARSLTLDIVPALLDRVQRDVDGIPRLSAADAAWLAVLRAARPGAAPAGLDPLTLDGPVPSALDRVVGPGTAGELIEAVTRAESAPALAMLAASLRRSAGRRSTMRRVRDAAALRAEGRRGVSLAVLGPDGAGKSTLVDGLVQALPFAVSVHYLGVFRTSERERLLRRVPGFALAGKLATLRSRSLQGALDAHRGRIVLYDRHVVDALLRPGRPTFRSRVSYGLLARACPPPDLFVVLDAPGEVMFARKGEHTVEILEERRQRYLDLRERYSALAVIDATQPAAVVLREVEDLVWALLAEPGW